jgi:hypothetical protein
MTMEPGQSSPPYRRHSGRQPVDSISQWQPALIMIFFPKLLLENTRSNDEKTT